MAITKNGMYVICGRPNVGKSTLANALAGEKVAIVSSKPQTTRNRITAVCERGDTQFVFMDTPGFHKARNKLGEYMNDVVRESVADVDAAVLVVEPEPEVGKPEAILIDRIREMGLPAVLVINKRDTIKPPEVLGVIAAYQKAYDFAEYLPISAKNNEGVDTLLDVLERFAQEGGALYPEDMASDQTERQIAAEVIREKMLICLEREVPHGVAVAIDRYEREDGILNISATIYCEKESHKGIIIGAKGAMLKRIGELAREELEDARGEKIFLETWVKVKENWRDSIAQLKNFGYAES